MYDPSKEKEEAYLELIERVSELDIDAARYLCTNALYLEDFKLCGSLIRAFYWERTPQGFMYWHNLNVRLEHGEDNV